VEIWGDECGLGGIRGIFGVLARFWEACRVRYEGDRKIYGACGSENATGLCLVAVGGQVGELWEAMSFLGDVFGHFETELPFWES
jgi:hypothetical protein